MGKANSRGGVHDFVKRGLIPSLAQQEKGGGGDSGRRRGGKGDGMNFRGKNLQRPKGIKGRRDTASEKSRFVFDSEKKKSFTKKKERPNQQGIREGTPQGRSPP